MMDKVPDSWFHRLFVQTETNKPVCVIFTQTDVMARSRNSQRCCVKIRTFEILLRVSEVERHTGTLFDERRSQFFTRCIKDQAMYVAVTLWMMADPVYEGLRISGFKPLRRLL